MVDALLVLSRLDHRADENGGDAVVAGAVVLVPSHDEQAVVLHRPLRILLDVLLQPSIALRDAAVVHVVALVGHHESDGGQL